MFSLPFMPNSNISSHHIYPEQHESFQWFFPINNMCHVNMDIRYDSGLMMFWDHDYDNYPSNGLELGWSIHHQNTTISNGYQFFSNEIFDFNNNQMVDRYDTLWHSIKIWDTNTDTVFTPLDVGIVAFNMDGWIPLEDDHVGIGRLVACDYEEDWAYVEYVNEIHDGNPDWCVPISEDPQVRAIAWNPHGIILADGTTVPTYDTVLGYWGETSDCS